MSTIPRYNTNSIESPRNNNDHLTCYACTHAGVPAFHSNRCSDPSSQCGQPRWEASAGSSLITPSPPPGHIPAARAHRTHIRSAVDPRRRRVIRWNRVVLLARGASLAVDPLFFYTVSLWAAGGDPCFYVDRNLAVAASMVRTCLDAVHLGHVWLQFRLAYVDSESLVVGCGKLVWDPRDIAAHYLRSFKGFWLDAFVILPIPQVIIWLVVPRLLRQEKITMIMTTLVVSFLVQFLPKVYHSLHLIRRLQKVTGYVFGSVWWRFNLNIFAYLIASHVVGACWYILATERLTGCLQQQCDRSTKCSNLSVYCSNKDYSHSRNRLAAGKIVHTNMTTINSKCLDVNGPFNYGIYAPVLLVYSSDSLAVKILYPIFWGLLNLSSFGNELEPTCNLLELIFSCFITVGGLALFVTLIGNIQVFLQTVTANKNKMQLRYRDMEWWMKRRQLPSRLRERVHHFQRRSWVTMGGQEDEMELIQHFPDGLRRDIRRYLCLDLVKKVPLFHILDDLILDNICDRLKPVIYSKGEKIIREGDPIQRMVFIVRGQVKRSQRLSSSFRATNNLEGGGFFGDELLTWCHRRPFVNRLPASSATFSCSDHTEAFSIDAQQLRYVIDHFRSAFASPRVKRTARYYSSNWRSWAAVVVQLAWRRRCSRLRNVCYAATAQRNHRLRQCAALFLSLRPHDHLE